MIIWFIFFFIVSQIIIEKAVAYCCLSIWFGKDVGFYGSLYYSFHDNWRISKSTSIARWLYNNPV